MSVNWACLSKNERVFFANSSILLSHVANLEIGDVAGDNQWYPYIFSSHLEDFRVAGKFRGIDNFVRSAGRNFRKFGFQILLLGTNFRSSSDGNFLPGI